LAVKTSKYNILLKVPRKVSICREIDQLNKLVLDKDSVLKGCQDQLSNLLEKDYGNLKVFIQDIKV